MIKDTAIRIRNKMREREIKNNVVAYSIKKYKKKMGREPDLANPKTFNEKTLWISIFYHNPLYTLCADKINVRRYVEQKLGKDKATELFCTRYGIWNDPEEIDFKSLPNSFVLKTNHASAQVIICPDKAKLNEKTIKRQLKEWLSMNYYYFIGEWQYKNIKPQIICEELLEEDIIDYRIFCFEGIPTYIKVTRHNASSPGGYDYAMFYPNWEKTEFTMQQNYGELIIGKPKNLEEMIEIAKKLSQDFHFVRVDLFSVGGCLYFAELTFTPNSSCEKYSDESYDRKFGSMFTLPQDEFVVKEIK